MGTDSQLFQYPRCGFTDDPGPGTISYYHLVGQESSTFLFLAASIYPFEYVLSPRLQYLNFNNHLMVNSVVSMLTS